MDPSSPQYRDPFALSLTSSGPAFPLAPHKLVETTFTTVRDGARRSASCGSAAEPPVIVAAESVSRRVCKTFSHPAPSSFRSRSTSSFMTPSGGTTAERRTTLVKKGKSKKKSQTSSSTTASGAKIPNALCQRDTNTFHTSCASSECHYWKAPHVEEELSDDVRQDGDDGAVVWSHAAAAEEGEEEEEEEEGHPPTLPSPPQAPVLTPAKSDSVWSGSSSRRTLTGSPVFLPCGVRSPPFAALLHHHSPRGGKNFPNTESALPSEEEGVPTRGEAVGSCSGTPLDESRSELTTTQSEEERPTRRHSHEPARSPSPVVVPVLSPLHCSGVGLTGPGSTVSSGSETARTSGSATKKSKKRKGKKQPTLQTRGGGALRTEWQLEAVPPPPLSFIHVDKLCECTRKKQHLRLLCPDFTHSLYPHSPTALGASCVAATRSGTLLSGVRAPVTLAVHSLTPSFTNDSARCETAARLVAEFLRDHWLLGVDVGERPPAALPYEPYLRAPETTVSTADRVGDVASTSSPSPHRRRRPASVERHDCAASPPMPSLSPTHPRKMVRPSIRMHHASSGAVRRNAPQPAPPQRQHVRSASLHVCSRGPTLYSRTTSTATSGSTNLHSPAAELPATTTAESRSRVKQVELLRLIASGRPSGAASDGCSDAEPPLFLYHIFSTEQRSPGGSDSPHGVAERREQDKEKEEEEEEEEDWFCQPFAYLRWRREWESQLRSAGLSGTSLVNRYVLGRPQPPTACEEPEAASPARSPWVPLQSPAGAPAYAVRPVPPHWETLYEFLLTPSAAEVFPHVITATTNVASERLMAVAPPNTNASTAVPRFGSVYLAAAQRAAAASADEECGVAPVAGRSVLPHPLRFLSLDIAAAQRERQRERMQAQHACLAARWAGLPAALRATPPREQHSVGSVACDSEATMGDRSPDAPRGLLSVPDSPETPLTSVKGEGTPAAMACIAESNEEGDEAEAEDSITVPTALMRTRLRGI